MHRPCDGKQDLNLYYFNLEDLVRDMFADPMAEGRQHLYFEMDIGPNGKRRFSDAHTCLVFEEAAREFGPGVVIFSLVLYIDGTYQWKHVNVCPVYISTLNNTKEIARQPSSQRVFALLPVYSLQDSTLKAKDKTYRKKEVRLFILSLLHLYYTIYVFNTLLLHCYSTAQCTKTIFLTVTALARLYAYSPRANIQALQANYLRRRSHGSRVPSPSFSCSSNCGWGRSSAIVHERNPVSLLQYFETQLGSHRLDASAPISARGQEYDIIPFQC